jgi:hypothetical protein
MPLTLASNIESLGVRPSFSRLAMPKSPDSSEKSRTADTSANPLTKLQGAASAVDKAHIHVGPGCCGEGAEASGRTEKVNALAMLQGAASDVAKAEIHVHVGGCCDTKSPSLKDENPSKLITKSSSEVSNYSVDLKSESKIQKIEYIRSNESVATNEVTLPKEAVKSEISNSLNDVHRAETSSTANATSRELQRSETYNSSNVVGLQRQNPADAFKQSLPRFISDSKSKLQNPNINNENDAERINRKAEPSDQIVSQRQSDSINRTEIPSRALTNLENKKTESTSGFKQDKISVKLGLQETSNLKRQEQQQKPATQLQQLAAAGSQTVATPKVAVTAIPLMKLRPEVKESVSKLSERLIKQEVTTVAKVATKTVESLGNIIGKQQQKSVKLDPSVSRLEQRTRAVTNLDLKNSARPTFSQRQIELNSRLQSTVYRAKEILSRMDVLQNSLRVQQQCQQQFKNQISLLIARQLNQSSHNIERRINRLDNIIGQNRAQQIKLLENMRLVQRLAQSPRNIEAIVSNNETLKRGSAPNADLARLRRLHEIEILLREGQELSHRLLDELLEILEESADGTNTVVSRRNKRVKFKSLERQRDIGSGFALELQTQKNSAAAKQIRADLAAKFTQNKVSINTKTGKIISAATKLPSRSLDVVMSKEDDEEISLEA